MNLRTFGFVARKTDFGLRVFSQQFVAGLVDLVTIRASGIVAGMDAAAPVIALAVVMTVEAGTALDIRR